MNTDLSNPYLEYYSRLVDRAQGTIPKGLSDFANGIIVMHILTKIKQFPAMKIELNPSTFAHHFSNLKEIYKKIEQFWNQSLDKEIDCEEIDLVEIAHHQNVKQIAKFLNLSIQTFILSSEREFFVSKILETSPSTQQYFMSIVESTLQKRKTFSPRKQREQRLYDKMIELDHENENLQNLIAQICKQKQETDQLYKKAQDKLLAKQMEIKKLNETLSDYTQTPLKKKQDHTFESQDKQVELVERLKQKIIEMGKQHEKQTSSLRQQVQFFSQKSQLTSHLQNELEIYKIKLQASTESIQSYTELSRKHAEIKLQLIEKQQIASELSRKLNASNQKLHQVSEKLLQAELELQRKNVIVEELKQKQVNKHTFFDDVSSFNSLSLHRTLSEHCPEVANSQAEFLYDSNKKLREELERATSTIKEREAELQKLKKLCEKRQNFETENKKLVEVIDQMTDHHDQQKSLILGCLHELRLKTLNELAPRERAKRQEMKASLKAENVRVMTRSYLKRSNV